MEKTITSVERGAMGAPIMAVYNPWDKSASWRENQCRDCGEVFRSMYDEPMTQCLECLAKEHPEYFSDEVKA